MSGKMSGDRVRREVPHRDNVTAPRSFVSIIITMERPIIDLLAQLQVHPILCYLTLDGITTFVCLITHLKRDILQSTGVTQALRQPFSLNLSPNFLGNHLIS